MKAKLPKGVGGGAPNMQSMIKQAQKMQEDMAALQEDLDAREYEIKAGGGAVSVTATAKARNRMRTTAPAVTAASEAMPSAVRRSSSGCATI